MSIPGAPVIPGLDDDDDDVGFDSKNTQGNVHIRIQQRNGRKSLTTVQGLPALLDYKLVLSAVKKEFCCNGTVVDDPEMGKVIQLQGDQRKNIADFLIREEICKKGSVKIHGF